jgi:hypothetical protein
MWERLSSREISHRGWKAAFTFNITCSFWITGLILLIRLYYLAHIVGEVITFKKQKVAKYR